METRKKGALWLLDKCPETISNKDKLPTKQEVLSCFFFHHVNEKETVPVSLRKTIDAVMAVWDRASLKTSTVAYCVKKLKSLVDQYTALKKSKGKKSDYARVREAMFVDDIKNEIFDIAAASQHGVNPEDVAFLEQQREDRSSSSMAGIDKIHAAKEEKKTKRKIYEKKKLCEAEEISKSIPSSSIRAAGSDSSSSSSIKSAFSDEDFQCSLKKTPKREGTKKSQVLKDPVLLATWDRENLSVRQATTSFAAAASAMGVQVSDLALSRSTVHRVRRSGREALAKQLGSTSATPDRLVLHWDGKLLPAISGEQEVQDRIAVLVTGEGQEQLLGVPLALDGTGQRMAEVVLNELEKADLRDKIVGLSFDTTASNTGMFQGACIRIEKDLDRDLLWLACRHHVSEVILRDVFMECVGPSSGPDIPLFKRFRETWKLYDTTKRSSILSDVAALNDPVIAELRDKAIRFLQGALEGDHPRADYEELICLSLVFLGVDDGKPLRQPGAVHHARWIAKAIYLLKIGILHEQVSMSRAEKRGVQRGCLFVSLVYSSYWHEAPLPLHAPWNDVQLAATLDKYPDRPLATAASKALYRHLWYLSEQVVGLAFFDSRVPDEERRQMAAALSRPARKGAKKLEGKGLKLDGTLHGRVTSKTKSLFDLLGASPDLTRPVREWDLDPAYKLARERAAALSVVNDAAERGIALIEKFNNSITRDEQQKQYLLKLVHRHRQLVGREKKADLAKKVF